MHNPVELDKCTTWSRGGRTPDDNYRFINVILMILMVILIVILVAILVVILMLKMSNAGRLPDICPITAIGV